MAQADEHNVPRMAQGGASEGLRGHGKTVTDRARARNHRELFDFVPVLRSQELIDSRKSSLESVTLISGFCASV